MEIVTYTVNDKQIEKYRSHLVKRATDCYLKAIQDGKDQKTIDMFLNVVNRYKGYPAEKIARLFMEYAMNEFYYDNNQFSPYDERTV